MAAAWKGWWKFFPASTKIYIIWRKTVSTNGITCELKRPRWQRFSWISHILSFAHPLISPWNNFNNSHECLLISLLHTDGLRQIALCWQPCDLSLSGPSCVLRLVYDWLTWCLWSQIFKSQVSQSTLQRKFSTHCLYLKPHLANLRMPRSLEFRTNPLNHHHCPRKHKKVTGTETKEDEGRKCLKGHSLFTKSLSGGFQKCHRNCSRREEGSEEEVTGWPENL